RTFAPSCRTRSSRLISTSATTSSTSIPSSNACSGPPDAVADAPATILVFDSGVGGLTVFREIKAARPDARYVYVADDAGFPYGNIPEAALITRIVHVIGGAIRDHGPDLVVIACNTASTLALTELRARFQVPFVGT